MNIYLAGPMRGLRSFNFPAFNAAATWLRNRHYVVFNPAEHDTKNGFDPITEDLTGNEDLAARGFDLRKALAVDLDYVALHADAVAVLPGWERSSGARAEVALAHALGLPVVPFERFEAAFWSPISDAYVYPAINAAHTIAPLTPASGTISAPPAAPLAGANGEIRTTSSTGGQKGTKPERFDLVPVGALTALARHYGVGAEKYDDNQWRLGYEWSKSYSALQRHLTAWWGGQDIDEETGSNHMAAVAWHSFTLLTFIEEHPDFDNRYKAPAPAVDPEAEPEAGGNVPAPFQFNLKPEDPRPTFDEVLAGAPTVSAWAKSHLDVDLLPWQSEIVDGVANTTPDQRRRLILGGRRNGRSTVLRVVNQFQDEVAKAEAKRDSRIDAQVARAKTRHPAGKRLA